MPTFLLCLKAETLENIAKLEIDSLARFCIDVCTVLEQDTGVWHGGGSFPCYSRTVHCSLPPLLWRPPCR